MLKFEEVDPRISLQEQFADDTNEAVILMILFTMNPEDVEAFKAAWAKDAAFDRAQPGFISAQLHQGICGSSTFLDYAVFESVAALAATTRQPEFGPLREAYPDSATARMLLFRRVATPNICVGEAKEAEVERLRTRVAELERRD